MRITRRNALTGATAAAVVTGAITAPLALKATGARAALVGDPVLPAYEVFEAARLKYIATGDRAHAVNEAVRAELSPEPHPNRTHWELSSAERDEDNEWRELFNRRVTARHGMSEDDFRNAYLDRVDIAYQALTDVEATTVAGLLCQVRAWWNVRGDISDTEIPKPDPAEHDYDAEVIVRRLYHDVARLAGEARS